LEDELQIKVCGITNLADAEAAVEYGADALGFIFAKTSPRYIDREKAQKIIAALPPFITTVGVFTEGNPTEICKTIETCGIDLIQFHGVFTRETVETFSERAIQVVTVDPKNGISNSRPFAARAYLFDRPKEGGASYEWEWVLPAQKWGKIILAGGLSLDNLQEAIEIVRPYAIDVCSGVESEKGIKDKIKLKRFIEMAKAS
jgi:phosphoribosylanthranilate isomerase